MNIALTIEQVKKAGVNELNQSEWGNRVERYAKYKNVCFYLSKSTGIGNSKYDRYFVVYELPTGLRFFKQISLTSVVSDRPFWKVEIDEKYNVTYMPFVDMNGNAGPIANTKENREVISNICKKLGVTVTTYKY